MRVIPLLPALVLLATIGCRQEVQQSGSGTSQSATSTAGGPPQHFDSINRTYHLKDLESATLKANGHDIHAWVMDDGGKREEGMMWLTAEDVKDDDGMIFAFPDVQPKSNGFWMENTILALDIIFISEKKKVLNIQEGVPHDKTSLPAAGSYKFVLEMKKGSAKRLGIGAGTVITIPDSVKGK